MEDTEFDCIFYKLCRLDNLYIFKINRELEEKIPPMLYSDLTKILFKKMKLGKACDIYQLTVEHLRYCGESVLLKILEFIIEY